MIRLYNVVLRENNISSPFAPKVKNWEAGLISGLTSLLGTGMEMINTEETNDNLRRMNRENIALQRETNDLNAQLQREANAQNYEMWNKSNIFNYNMWKQNNEYNNPKNQVARLLAAGINPASGLGQVSQAGAISSANPASMNAPHMEAPRNIFEMRPTDFSGISDAGIAAVNAYNSSRLMQSETRNKDVLTANTAFDVSYKNKTMYDNIRLLKKIADGKGWESDLAKKQLDFIDATQQYDIQMKYGDYHMQMKSLEMMDKQIQQQELQNQILEITKGYASKMNQAQIAQLWSSVHQAEAQIGLINSNRLLTDAQRDHEIVKRVGSIIDNGMKGLDFDIKKSTKDALIQSYKNNANKGMYEAFDAWKYNPSGNPRGVSDHFGADNFLDKFTKMAKKVGYSPRF